MCVYMFIMFNPKVSNNTKEVLPDSQNPNPVHQSSLKILKLNLSSYTTRATSLGKNTRNKQVASATFAVSQHYT